MSTTRSRGRHRRTVAGRRCRRLVALGAALAVVAGLTLLGVAIGQHHHHDAAMAAQDARRARVDQRAAAEARQSARALAKARNGPGHASGSTTGGAVVSSITESGATLIIPALEVRAPIVATGAVRGSMTVPSDIRTVGWYDGIDTTTGGRASATAAHRAPFPGQPGVAVLAGHVDWAGKGPGALYYLSHLVVGDPVEVVGSNGAVSHWRVSRAPITIAKSSLPADLFTNGGPPKLALVTCGGPFDAATGHYQDNVIVWAALED